jgi:uncharacterized protein (TIRG00374 family)
MKKYSNYIILVFLIVVTTIVIGNKLDMSTFGDVIKNADTKYLFAGLLCMFVYWGIEAGIMDVLLKKIEPKTKYWTSLKTTMIGQYYSFLTPFASGGQPAQLYEMGKDNISFGHATAVLVSKFLLFQITVTMYSLVLIIARIGFLMTTLKKASGFVFAGLIINSLGLSIIIMLAFKPELLRKVAHKLIWGLHRITIVKHPALVIENVNLIVHEYRIAIKYFMEDKIATMGMFILSIIQLTAFFSITYFVYKALGLSGASVLDIISLQAILYMAVSFVPVPGTAGASEAGFSLLLGSVFTGNLVVVAVLLWRGISYYFGIIFCGIFTLYVYATEKVTPRYEERVKTRLSA